MDQYNYCTPGRYSFGDSWDIYSPPNPCPAIQSYNLRARADELVENFKHRAAWFSHNKLLWAFGCDFNYQNAWTMFKNMDQLITYINENSDKYGVRVKYSLLSEYFEAVHKLGKTWGDYSGDFFPYNDNNVSYWSGYFTSRNKLKGLTRSADNVQRLVDAAFATALAGGYKLDQQKLYEYINELRYQNAVAQHHDGVSGTARPHVVDDYEYRLNIGIQTSFEALQNIVPNLLDPVSAASGASGPAVSTNPQEIQALLLQGKPVSVVLYNTLGTARDEYVEIKVPIAALNVTDSNGRSIVSQIDPPHNQIYNLTTVDQIHLGVHFDDHASNLLKKKHTVLEASFFTENQQDLYSLWFEVQIPAFGWATYFLTPVNLGSPSSSTRGVVTFQQSYNPQLQQDQKNSDPTHNIPINDLAEEKILFKTNGKEAASNSTITNGQLTVSFNNNGLIGGITGSHITRPFTVTQNFFQYNSSADEQQPSGAYIFRNNGTALPLGIDSNKYSLTIVQGNLVQTAHQIWHQNVFIGDRDPSKSTNVTHSIRLFRSTVNNDNSQNPIVNFIETRHGVGPLQGNKEMISRWSTSIKSNGKFSQDDSGFLFLERTFNSSQSLIIPGNYYPVVQATYIQDSDYRLSVLTSQSCGCSSLASGELEVMVHRRTLQDDYRGVSSPLNDTNRIEFSHWISVDSQITAETQRAQLSLMQNNPIVPLYAPVGSQGISHWLSHYTNSFSALSKALPQNIHLLNFQVFGPSDPTIILRLQHLYQAESVSPLAAPVSIDLSTVFNSPALTLATVTPLTLSANQKLSTCQQNRWSWSSEASPNPASPRDLPLAGTTVTLLPSQILTFSLTFSTTA